MKKIISFILAVAMCITVLAAIPVNAASVETYVHGETILTGKTIFEDSMGAVTSRVVHQNSNASGAQTLVWQDTADTSGLWDKCAQFRASGDYIVYDISGLETYETLEVAILGNISHSGAANLTKTQPSFEVYREAVSGWSQNGVSTEATDDTTFPHGTTISPMSYVVGDISGNPTHTWKMGRSIFTKEQLEGYKYLKIKGNWENSSQTYQLTIESIKTQGEPVVEIVAPKGDLGNNAAKVSIPLEAYVPGGLKISAVEFYANHKKIGEGMLSGDTYKFNWLCDDASDSGLKSVYAVAVVDNGTDLGMRLYSEPVQFGVSIAPSKKIVDYSQGFSNHISYYGTGSGFDESWNGKSDFAKNAISQIVQVEGNTVINNAKKAERNPLGTSITKSGTKTNLVANASHFWKNLTYTFTADELTSYKYLKIKVNYTNNQTYQTTLDWIRAFDSNGEMFYENKCAASTDVAHQWVTEASQRAIVWNTGNMDSFTENAGYAQFKTSGDYIVYDLTKIRDAATKAGKTFGNLKIMTYGHPDMKLMFEGYQDACSNWNPAGSADLEKNGYIRIPTIAKSNSQYMNTLAYSFTGLSSNIDTSYAEDCTENSYDYYDYDIRLGLKMDANASSVWFKTYGTGNGCNTEPMKYYKEGDMTGLYATTTGNGNNGSASARELIHTFDATKPHTLGLKISPTSQYEKDQTFFINDQQVGKNHSGNDNNENITFLGGLNTIVIEGRCTQTSGININSLEIYQLKRTELFAPTNVLVDGNTAKRFVPAGAKTLTYTIPKTTAETTIELYNGDYRVTSDKVSAGTTTATLNLCDLEADETYAVKIGENTVHTFKTTPQSEYSFNIKSVEVSKDDITGHENIDVEGTVVVRGKFSNPTAKNISLTGYAAVYNNTTKEILNVGVMPSETISKYSEEILSLGVTIPSVEGGLSDAELKLMFWETGSLMPLCNVTTKIVETTERCSMPNVFSDNMILQRGDKTSIFGYAPSGSTVEVALGDDYTATGKAVSSKFDVELENLTASNVGRKLTVTVTKPDETIETFEFNNVVVGDVYYGSGQSNMNMGLDKTNSGTSQDTSSTPYERVGFVKNVRYMKVKQLDDPMLRETDQDGSIDVYETWKEFSGDATDLKKASAVMYCTLWGLRENGAVEEDVPLGFVDCSWGASRINNWISPNLLSQHNQSWYEHWYEDTMTFPSSAGSAWYGTSDLYYAMARSIMPFDFKAAVWYQGCSDTYVTNYTDVAVSMINEMREDFGYDIPYIIVQLCGYGVNDNRLNMRLWQWDIAKEVSNTSVVVTNDTGHALDIHPCDKDIVGDRIARHIMKYVDNDTTTPYTGPVYNSSSVSGNTITVNLDYVNDGIHGNLVSLASDESFAGFEVSADGTTWTAASSVSISGNSLKITSSVANPTHIRYGMVQDVLKSVGTETGAIRLPLAPFSVAIGD